MIDFKFKIVQDYLNENKADGLILLTSVNTKWYTNNFNNDFCLIVITKEKAHCFFDPRDINTIKPTRYLELHLYENVDQWIKFVKKLHLSKILIDATNTTIKQYNDFIKPFADKTIDFDATCLRIVKTNDEIKLLKKSAEIVCNAILYMQKNIRVGMTEIEVADKIAKHMFANGADALSFPTIVTFGKNTTVIHAAPTNRKLELNEMILVDAGCVYKNYCSDITRCWWIGKPTNDMLKTYEVVLKANLLGIENVKAGVIGKEVDKKIRDYIKMMYHGYDFPHGSGHGVGVQIHEKPQVNKVYDKPLLENSIVTIEPGIYLQNKFGIRIEDTILVTKNGCQVLTKSVPKDIFISK